MKLAVLNFLKCSPDSIMASNRIALFIAKELNATLIDSSETCRPQKYDLVFVVNGPFLACSFKSQAIRLIESNDKFIYVQNDYTMTRPGNLKAMTGKIVAYWQNFGHEVGGNKKFIDWNKLTYLPQKPKPPKRKGMIYWGSFRKNRESLFDLYFKYPKCPVTIVSKKSSEFFKRYPRCNFEQADDIIAHCADFESTLYIEDPAGLKKMHSPANRFYEAVSAGIPMLIDVRSWPCFERARLEGMKPLLVAGPSGVAEKLRGRKILLEAQRKCVKGRDFQKELRQSLHQLASQL